MWRQNVLYLLSANLCVQKPERWKTTEQEIRPLQPVDSFLVTANEMTGQSHCEPSGINDPTHTSTDGLNVCDAEGYGSTGQDSMRLPARSARRFRQVLGLRQMEIPLG